MQSDIRAESRETIHMDALKQQIKRCNCAEFAIAQKASELDNDFLKKAEVGCVIVLFEDSVSIILKSILVFNYYV